MALAKFLCKGLNQLGLHQRHPLRNQVDEIPWYMVQNISYPGLSRCWREGKHIFQRLLVLVRECPRSNRSLLFGRLVSRRLLASTKPPQSTVDFAKRLVGKAPNLRSVSRDLQILIAEMT